VDDNPLPTIPTEDVEVVIRPIGHLPIALFKSALDRLPDMNRRLRPDIGRESDDRESEDGDPPPPM
jgi:hypothetical protein